MYILHPCRYDKNNDVERCDYDDADVFTIYRIGDDDREHEVVSYEFDDSAEQAAQWANAHAELIRLLKQ